MLTSKKIALMCGGIYFSTAFVYGFFRESDILPPEAIHEGMLSSALFMTGVVLGAILFPFGPDARLQAPFAHPGRGLVYANAVLGILFVLILATGPVSPLAAALSMRADSFSVALLREDVLKLNQSEFFIRLYSWTRDLAAPVVFALSVKAMMERKSGAVLTRGLIGLGLALVVGLWSGQKATIVNYLLATILLVSRDLRDLGWKMLRWMSVIVVMVLATFAVTQPELGLGSADLLTSIVNRVFWVPLEVASVYVYCKGTLGSLVPLDAVPYLGQWFSTGISLENHVAMEFFHQGIDSGHSNAPAFGYAYVMGGQIGSLAAGVWCMLVFRLAAKSFRSCSSPVAVFCLEAFLGYLFLDLLYGNFLQYTLKALLVALLVKVVVAGVRSPLRGRDGTGLRPPSEVDAPSLSAGVPGEA